LLRNWIFFESWNLILKYRVIEFYKMHNMKLRLSSFKYNYLKWSNSKVNKLNKLKLKKVK
jgi:hypothetical protein